ncbi:MAG: AsmA-like C-terminal region-containing protein, partial [Pseudomonadota bacterium]
GETRAPRETVADLARVFAPIFALAKEREGIAIPMVAELNVGTVVMGEAVIRDVSVEARTTPDGLALERIEALLPGETSVMASAVAEEDLRGTVNLLSSQPAALARWWTGGAFAAGTIEPVMVEADIRTSGEGFGAQRLALRLGQSRASGRIEYASHGTEPPLLTLKMTAPRLSLDDLLDAGALVGAAGIGLADAPNIQLNVLVNEAIIGTVAGATVSLNATYNDGRLTIDALSADDLAGAEVFASGEIVDLMSEPVGTVRGRVRVEDGEALAGALASVDTGVADLARFVPALTPADLRVNLSGQTGEDGEDLSLSVIGEAGGTALNVSAAGLSAGGDILAQPVSLNVSAENSDAAELLRQIGVAAVGSAPAGSIRLALDGTPRERMMGTARVDLLGVEATFEGDMRVGERIAPSGELAVSVNDQSTLETALGVSFPQLTPLSLTATLAPGFAGAVRAAPVAGTAAEMPFDADLELAAGRVTGSLAIAEADLLALTSLVLGGEAWTATSDGGSWPRSIFAPSIWPAYNAALSVDAGRLKVGDDIIANASLDVALGRDRLAVENLRGAWSGGTVLAGFGIDRDGSSARLSCDFTLENIDLSGNAWRGGAEAITSGRLDLTAEFAGSGTTVEGLVADLSGRGDVAVRDAVVRGLNITGPEAVVEPLLSTASPTEDRTRAAFEAHLSASDLSVESLTAKLSVNDGTMRVEAVEGDSALADAIGPTALDMADWRIRSDWSIDLDTAGDGEAVAVGLTFDGAADAPERTVDVAGLTTWLNLRQLERQIETVEEENEALGAAGDDVPPVVEGNVDVHSPDGAASDRDVLDASQDENDGAEDAGDLRGGENGGGANGDGAPLGDGVIRRRPIPIPSPDRAPGGAQEGWLGHPAASVRFAALP